MIEINNYSTNNKYEKLIKFQEILPLLKLKIDIETIKNKSQFINYARFYF